MPYSLAQKQVVRETRKMAKCWECQVAEDHKEHPEGYLYPSRLSLNHYAVRFGDSRERNLTVLIDGEDVTKKAHECLAGPDGWVAYHPKDAEGHVLWCTCPHHFRQLALEIRYGNVEVAENAVTWADMGEKENG